MTAVALAELYLAVHIFNGEQRCGQGQGSSPCFAVNPTVRGCYL